jgi:hypothetical protein
LVIGNSHLRFFEVVDEGLEHGEVVHAPSLIAIAGAEDHHLDRGLLADGAPATLPGAVSERPGSPTRMAVRPVRERRYRTCGVD